MSKAIISQLVNKYKTKRTVETEHLGGRPKKSTPHNNRKRYNSKIGIRYFRKYCTAAFG